MFVEALGPPPRLVAVGAGDIAEALCALARPLGWRTVVVDPRAGLATRERVPSADEIVVAWPDEIDVDAGTALVSLVHEERIDLPALRRGVEGGAFYVGALGSKRTQAKRREQLGAVADRSTGRSGSTSAARRPAEIALEIIAEVLAVHRQGEVAGLDARARRGSCPAAKPSPSRPIPSRKCSHVSAVFAGSQRPAPDGTEHPEREIDDPAADEERASTVCRPRQDEADDAEGQMDEVVQDRHLERAEQFRAAAVAGKAQLTRVRGDARHEPEDPDEQEDDGGDGRDCLTWCALTHGFGSPAGRVAARARRAVT